MGQTLYRKYRPSSFSEVVGQEHIIKVLEATVASKNPSHAYLLAGPRGTGKTTIARIFAKKINEISDTDDISKYIDIVEIDAASNRRIDEVREIRQRVQLTPTQLTYKVYIIDEVHMLTKEAFNALLKTLEEPPAHAIFILATTELHALPDTIISRTQKHILKSPTPKQIAEHLQSIAASEKTELLPDAALFIADAANGGVRDAMSTLGQLQTLSDGQITIANVEDMLGMASTQAIKGVLDQYVDSCVNLSVVQNLIQTGVKPEIIASQLLSEVKKDAFSDKLSEKHLLLAEKLLTVRSAFDTELALLAALYVEQRAPQQTKTIDSAAIPKAEPVIEVAEGKPEEPIVRSKTEEDIIVSNELTDEAWADILNEVRDLNQSVYSLLRMTIPAFSGDTLRLQCRFALHEKQLQKDVSKQVIMTAAQKYIKAEKLETLMLDDPKTPNGSLETAGINRVIDFMGGGEVLREM